MLAGISLGKCAGRVLVSWDALECRQREGLVKPVAEVEATLSPGAPLGSSRGNRVALY